MVNGKLTAFPTYKFFYKQLPNTRRAAAVAPEAPARGLLPAIDKGKSWDEILRFKDITFETGGKFKACFCDYETLAAGKYCKTVPSCGAGFDEKVQTQFSMIDLSSLKFPKDDFEPTS